jgi:hypothetical protein
MIDYVMRDPETNGGNPRLGHVEQRMREGHRFDSKALVAQQADGQLTVEAAG